LIQQEVVYYVYHHKTRIQRYQTVSLNAFTTVTMFQRLLSYYPYLIR